MASVAKSKTVVKECEIPTRSSNQGSDRELTMHCSSQKEWTEATAEVHSLEN